MGFVVVAGATLVAAAVHLLVVVALETFSLEIDSDAHK